MHWILTITRLEINFVVLEGDAGEFHLPRADIPEARVGDIVRLEHAIRGGRAKLNCQVIAGA